MSINKLLIVMEDLNELDLENLVNRALFLRARRKASALSSEETVLLRIINQGIPKSYTIAIAVINLIRYKAKPHCVAIPIPLRYSNNNG